MNRRHRLAVVGAALAAGTLGVVTWWPASPDDRLPNGAAEATRDVIATVGERELTAADLPVRLDRLGDRDPGQAHAAIRRALDELIDTELLVAEAERIGIRLSDEELAALRRDEPRPEVVERHAREEGITVADYRLRRRHRALARRVIEHQVYPSVPVGPGEIERYAREHAVRYRTPDQYRLRGVFVSAPKSSAPQHVAEARQRAEAAAAQLARGVQFETVARRYSDGLHGAEGGALGDVALGEPPLDQPAVAAAVRALGDHVTSDIIRTEDGFWLFRVDAHLAPEDLPRDERLRRAEADLRIERGERLVRTYLDRLRARARVSILLPVPKSGGVAAAEVRP